MADLEVRSGTEQPSGCSPSEEGLESLTFGQGQRHDSCLLSLARRKDNMPSTGAAAPLNLEALLPPLTSEEFEALRLDIQEHGVLHEIFVDENGEVLDGRNRLKIDPNAPRKVISGLSPAEKQAFVFRSNFARRNLSPSQKQEATKRMKAVAFALRAEDRKKWTQKTVAAALGRSRETIRDWFEPPSPRREASTSNGGTAKTSKKSSTTPAPDARVKVNGTAKRMIAERVAQGESQAQVAADFGISQQAVSAIVRKENKQAETKKAHEEAVKKIEGDCGIIHGDFRSAGSQVPDQTVDLIFTDPPYDLEAVPLYKDLGQFAVRVLRPGGWLLAYAGQAHFPAVLDAIRVDGLQYAWMFCILHSGGDLRFRNFKLQNHWKPIIAMYKPPLTVTWDWFPDTLSGGKEKDLHPWQQAEREASHFIDRLSAPGGFVCDPFAGSGTTLSAAKKLKRRWLGFETSQEHIASARERLSA